MIHIAKTSFKEKKSHIGFEERTSNIYSIEREKKEKKTYETHGSVEKKGKEKGKKVLTSGREFGNIVEHSANGCSTLKIKQRSRIPLKINLSMYFQVQQ